MIFCDKKSICPTQKFEKLIKFYFLFDARLCDELKSNIKNIQNRNSKGENLTNRNFIYIENKFSQEYQLVSQTDKDDFEFKIVLLGTGESERPPFINNYDFI